VKRETTVLLDWIAERLQMGAHSTVSPGKSLAPGEKLCVIYREILDS
jgi:hypothetical protein